MALLAIVVILGFGSAFGILCLGLKIQYENKTVKKWVKEYFPNYEKDLAEFDLMRDKLFCYLKELRHKEELIEQLEIKKKYLPKASSQIAEIDEQIEQIKTEHESLTQDYELEKDIKNLFREDVLKKYPFTIKDVHGAWRIMEYKDFKKIIKKIKKSA